MDAHLFLTLYLGIMGLLVGSFANVCVHRIPRRESIVSPRSQCPNCQHPIAWYDNIPILSWLLLRRKCRYCKHPIAWRYPLLELTMGLMWASIAWFYPIESHDPVFLAQAISLVTLLWILTLIDLETFLLPNTLTFPGIALGLGFAAYFDFFLDSLIGAVAGYGIFWLVARLFFMLTGKEGMGQGDFKLLAMLGAYMGWQAIPFIILLSSLTGTVIGSLLLIISKKGLRAEIPFGPYLAAAGVVWFFWSDSILHWYQGVFT